MRGCFQAFESRVRHAIPPKRALNSDARERGRRRGGIRTHHDRLDSVSCRFYVAAVAVNSSDAVAPCTGLYRAIGCGKSDETAAPTSAASRSAKCVRACEPTASRLRPRGTKRRPMHGSEVVRPRASVDRAKPAILTTLQNRPLALAYHRRRSLPRIRSRAAWSTGGEKSSGVPITAPPILIPAVSVRTNVKTRTDNPVGLSLHGAILIVSAP